MKKCPICNSELEVIMTTPISEPTAGGGSQDVSKITYKDFSFFKCSNPYCPYREKARKLPHIMKPSENEYSENQRIGLLGSNC